MNGKKKGLHPLAWVAIGCGGLMLIGLIIAVVFTMFVAKEVKDFAETADRNPTLAAAKILDFANPDIEIIDSDDNAQTVTFRNLQTGEEATLDLEGIQEGRIAWINESGARSQISVDPDGGGITATDGQGQTTKIGADIVDLPAWVPAYPGTKPVGLSSTENNTEMTGILVMETEDGLKDVDAWYKEKLESEGFTISDHQILNNIQILFKAEHSGQNRTINFQIYGQTDGKAKTGIHAHYIHTK